jgi:hypothetical protein
MRRSHCTDPDPIGWLAAQSSFKAPGGVRHPDRRHLRSAGGHARLNYAVCLIPRKLRPVRVRGCRSTGARSLSVVPRDSCRTLLRCPDRRPCAIFCRERSHQRACSENETQSLDSGSCISAAVAGGRHLLGERCAQKSPPSQLCHESCAGQAPENIDVFRSRRNRASSAGYTSTGIVTDAHEPIEL